MSMSDFVFAAKLADLTEGGILATVIDDIPVALTLDGGEVRAFGDVCTHDGGPLADGTIDHGCVICPRHGATFNLKTGKATFPAAGPIPIYEARVEGDGVAVKLQSF